MRRPSRPSRPSYPQHGAPPPPPLPPETRTVGQVVGESVKWYRENFFAALSIGLGPALTGVIIAAVHGDAQFWAVLVVGGFLSSLSLVAATLLVRNMDVEGRQVVQALAAGTLVMGPGAILAWYFGPLRDVWLTFVVLAVPAVLVEGLSGPRGIVRSMRLARADIVHAFGTILTLDLLSVLCSSVLFFLLRNSGDAVQSVAAFVSLLIIAPLLYIGAAILYDDQTARTERRLSRKERAVARREHVATAPREIVPTRPGRAPRPAQPRPRTRPPEGE